MKIQVNHQNLMNNNQKPKYQNYMLNENNNYISGIKYKHEIKINQSSTKQAPIKKFMKQNHQSIKMSSDKIKVEENKNNNRIIQYPLERKYNPIYFHEKKFYQNQLDNIPKKPDLTIYNNKIINNNNLQYHEIDMTTKKENNESNIQQNRCIYRNNQNEKLSINNNKDNKNFIKNLRNYNDKKPARNTFSSMKIQNQQFEKKHHNQIITNITLKENNILKNTTIIISQKKQNKIIKNNDFRTDSVGTKDLPKYVENKKQNEQKKRNQETIYIKKHQNIKKEIKQINKFINCKIDKNDNFFFRNENKIKNEIIEHNEYFLLKGKEKEKIFKKNLINYFSLKGSKIQNKNKKLSQESHFNFILEGKKFNDLKPNEKLKEILLFIEKYSLSEEIKKELINKLNLSIEANKPKKIKFEENGQKNANDISSKKKKKEKIILPEEKEKEKEINDFNKYNKIYGFNNDGNNCYLNSSLQLLTRIKDLKNEVFNFQENYQDNDTQGRLIIEFRNILKKIENSTNDNLIINPARLKSIMGNVDERYNSYGQEDSNEFIANFINAILSETANKEIKVKKLNIVNELEKRPYENLYKKFYQRKGNSFILNLFYGITKLTKYCKKCGTINSIKFNVYNMLEFPLYSLAKKYKNKDLALNDLYNKYIEEIKNDGTCNNCNEDELYSKTTIYTLPKYLMICLQRTCDNEYFCNNVLYPKNINLKSEFDNNKSSYTLECVIEHSGGISYGHYTALAPVDKDNNIWYRFNDSYCNQFKTDFQSNNAFILLYKLK